MTIRKIALISFHTSPLATLGGKDTGGMNVFVRETARELARRNVAVDIYTRSQSQQTLRIDPRVAPNVRLIHVPAGPEAPVPKRELWRYVPSFTVTTGFPAWLPSPCASAGGRVSSRRFIPWRS